MGDVLPFRRVPDDPDEPTEPCTHCGHPVDTAAIRCRRCGKSTLPPRQMRRRIPWWVLLGLILALVVVIGWLTGR
jgi:hypothetical protein